MSCNSENTSQKKLKPPIEKSAETIVTGDNLLNPKNLPKKHSKEKQDNHVKIVAKYGEQWDFCTCIQANDSINKVSEKGLSEKQAEILMKRWEIVENKCKEFLTNPNRTLEEREIHEMKVAKCLKK